MNIEFYKRIKCAIFFVLLTYIAIKNKSNLSMMH